MRNQDDTEEKNGRSEDTSAEMTVSIDTISVWKSMKNSKLSFFKRVWKRFKNYRGIYITAIIHCADVITDYLVLCQYIFFAIDEQTVSDCNYENINYTAMAIASFLAILLSRLLSCHYINIFTHNKWDLFLNLFDLYIFKEILASHQTGFVSFVYCFFFCFFFCLVYLLLLFLFLGC